LDGSGFSGLFEGANTLVNSSSVTQKRMAIQCGIMDSRVGDYYGLVMNASTGTMDAAIYIQDETPPATWSNALDIKGQSGVHNFLIGMDGKITTKPSDSGSTEINILNTAGSRDCSKDYGSRISPARLV
jgi:hypothetical protein